VPDGSVLAKEADPALSVLIAQHDRGVVAGDDLLEVDALRAGSVRAGQNQQTDEQGGEAEGSLHRSTLRFVSARAPSSLDAALSLSRPIGAGRDVIV
jgi:hypothetical protein